MIAGKIESINMGRTQIELDTVIDELGSLGLWTPQQLVNEPTLQEMDKFIQECS